MNTHIVTWKKEYYEDIGEQDENGFLEYAYRYFIYSFYFYNKQEARVRRYTDTIDECSIFFEDKNRRNVEQLEKTTIISAVIHFMKTTQGVEYYNYFEVGSGYVPISLTEIGNDLSSFSFIELE